MRGRLGVHIDDLCWEFVLSCFTPLQPQDEARVGILDIFWREGERERRAGARPGAALRFLFLCQPPLPGFQCHCAFSFIYFQLCANARRSRSRTQTPSRVGLLFATCVGGGNGARLKCLGNLDALRDWARHSGNVLVGWGLVPKEPPI